MVKETYGRMLLNEFSNMKAKYDCNSFLQKLISERIKAIDINNKDDVAIQKLNKEHYLVRYFKQTRLEILELERKIKNNPDFSIDDPKIGNKQHFKNDLMCLRVFISKLEQEGFKKALSAS